MPAVGREVAVGVSVGCTGDGSVGIFDNDGTGLEAQDDGVGTGVGTGIIEESVGADAGRAAEVGRGTGPSV